MVHLLNSNYPSWFLTYETGMDLGAVIISLAVAIVAFRVYRLTDKRQPKLFSYAFFLIAFSYFLQFVINYILLFHMQQTPFDLEDLSSNAIHVFGIQVHEALFIIALITLLYMTYKVKRPQAYWFMTILAMLATFLGRNEFGLIYMIPTIIFAYLVSYYYHNFVKTKHFTQFIVFIAFLFFFVSSVSFLFISQSVIWFLIGNILELFAMLLILINLILILVVQK